MPRRGQRLAAVGAALILGLGCRTVSNKGGMHALPSVPGSTNLSDSPLDQPFEPSGEGVAERSIFTAPSAEGYAVEIRDFLVSPAQPEADLAIAGAAVLDVLQGSGKATVGERKIELRPGTVFTIDEGEPLRITARGEPLTLRSWIVSPRREP